MTNQTPDSSYSSSMILNYFLPYVMNSYYSRNYVSKMANLCSHVQFQCISDFLL